jgi:preprotein translocase subunit SecB
MAEDGDGKDDGAPAAAGDGGEPATAAADEAAATGEAPPLAVAAQYIKDLSFEAPTAPAVFGMMQQQEPEITININVNAQPLQENFFEVVLQIHAECKVGETVAFILEVSYGGLFSLNVAPNEVQPMLLIDCPRLLFPFVRYIVSDTTRDGGFPPLMLGPVDFVAMYQEQQTAAQSQAEADAGPS